MTTPVLRPAVFLDRDGVLNEVVVRNGKPESPRTLAELQLVPDLNTVARLADAGLLVFIITNQPDVVRGRITLEAMEAIIGRIRAVVPIDDYLACLHDDADNCACRKPKPGMILDLARRWHVALDQSFVIGDMWRDADAARAAGCRSILIKRDYNDDARADIAVPSLTAAVDTVLEAAGERDRMDHATRYLRETARIASTLDTSAIEGMARALAGLRDAGGRLFFLGVGGSAANAGHATNDFRKIAGMECYSATDNVAELTARTNDEGWDSTFVEYLRGSRLTDRDGVFVFSVGGGDAERGISANLVHAVRYAREQGAQIFGVVGRQGGYTATVADHCVVVPVVNDAAVTPHTEAFQAVVWHLLVSHPLLQRVQTKWESVTP